MRKRQNTTWWKEEESESCQVAQASACGGLFLQGLNSTGEQIAEKALFVIPSKARDLLFFAKPKKQQIPRAKPARRNDTMRFFLQPLKPVPLGFQYVFKTHAAITRR